MTPFRTHSATVVLSLKYSSEDRALSRHDNLSADVSEVKYEGLETVPHFPEEQTFISAKAKIGTKRETSA